MHTLVAPLVTATSLEPIIQVIVASRPAVVNAHSQLELAASMTNTARTRYLKLPEVCPPLKKMEFSSHIASPKDNKNTHDIMYSYW